MTGPYASRPRGANPGAGQIAHLEAEQPQSTNDIEILDLIARLGDRVIDLELRLAVAGVPHSPTALDRQRQYSRARLDRVSPVARFTSEREVVR